MGTEKRPHILAYDISDEKRLRLVAKCAKQHGVRIQYSFFLLWLKPAEPAGLIDELSQLIDPAEDDIRLYPLPMTPGINHIGKLHLPKGVLLLAPDAANLLNSQM